jgi:4-hydroxybenzoate polyprenyltransferase
MRPAQWIKNGLVFAGLVYGGKLLDPPALASAATAAVLFCVVSSGFYVINDVRDADADRLHPGKRQRPVAAGELSAGTALATGIVMVLVAFIGSALLSVSFLVVVLTYAALMSAYNLGLKDAVILDVFAIAGGFVLRAIGGAVAVDVSISPWLLICTLLLALLIGFGKRRHELMSLADAGLHRRNLDVYSRSMLDQAVAITAAGTLIAYSIYSFDTNNVIHDRRFMVTVPIVAYGIFRYLHVLYRQGDGGEPESLLVTDRPMLIAVLLWGGASAVLLYLPS